MRIFGLTVGISSTEMPDLNTLCALQTQSWSISSPEHGDLVDFRLPEYNSVIFFRCFESLTIILLKKASLDFPVHLFRGIKLILRPNIVVISSRKSWPDITPTGEFSVKFAAVSSLILSLAS